MLAEMTASGRAGLTMLDGPAVSRDDCAFWFTSDRIASARTSVAPTGSREKAGTLGDNRPVNGTFHTIHESGLRWRGLCFHLPRKMMPVPMFVENCNADQRQYDHESQQPE